MPYLIFKAGEHIGTATTINILNGGVLECRESFGGRVTRYINPSQWDHATYVSPEE